ncbi:MAG: F0F1 ATP synthase subunit B [Acidimicrobiia bacterium]|nr:F0F1 ATP synthase subunit B [Acidimicrobiia bacterium]MYE71998.1 F0F1 ATP synthase subunit B [Acidimicrobiia bacterium]MYJ62240.1 F0F1 ATP synthase subunit B [Acidimicrobiia bacterium]
MMRRLWAAAAVVVAAVALSASAVNAAGETIGSCIFEELEGAQFEGIEGDGFTAVKELKTRYKAGDDHAGELIEEFESDLEGCLKAPNPILPERTEIIWGGLAFVILLALMYWKLFPPVKNLMEQRTQRIQDAIDDADRQRAEAAEVKANYEAELADAKAEAARIVDEARDQAATVRADLQARAEADIAEMRERAAADVEASKRQAIADLQSEVSDIALGAAEAVLGRSLEDPEMQRQLVDDYIARVGADQG